MVKQLLRFLSFYMRFLISFSNIGYQVRRWFWGEQHFDHSGQTWLVTGASGGIGKAVVTSALKAGANVIVVARSQEKLTALKQELPPQLAERIDLQAVDLSLQREVDRLVKQLRQQHTRIDVLINNVGVLLDDLSVTDEGVETSFATNVLNHFQLTNAVLDNNILDDQATVINVTSGGMYNVPMTIEELDVQTDQYNGVFAYAFHKRAQAVLTQYWRDKYASGGRQFYVMHPGWADTQGIKTSLPRFRKILKSVLRDENGGADTILWLAGQRPQQQQADVVWFDRKPRGTHLLGTNREANASASDLVGYLQSRLVKE